MHKVEKVLFVCIHNSARSQMAEAFTNKYGGDMFRADSAGLEPGTLNPFAVEVMQEAGIDISKNKVKDVFDLFKEGRKYKYVITVCDEARAQKCPVFPSALEKIQWSFPDPSAFAGTREEILSQTRIVRDQIKQAVLDLVEKRVRNHPAE